MTLLHRRYSEPATLLGGFCGSASRRQLMIESASVAHNGKTYSCIDWGAKVSNGGEGGESLLEALRSGDLRNQEQVSLVGMIDVSDQDGYVHFALGGCDDWIDLPLEMIHSWEATGQRACRDHSHTVVRLNLESPQDSSSAVLFRLLKQTSSSASPAGTAQQSPNMLMAAQAAGGIGGEGMCKYYACGTCVDGTVMLCADGALSGCIPNTCSDIPSRFAGVFDPVRFRVGQSMFR